MQAGQELLEWYRAHRRDLPWRRCADPWAIWVSEVMLQQTRVDCAIPYFERFLDRFPTPAALAAAPLEEALALWSGLGYYRRLRLLHRAAGQVAGSGGEVPSDVASLRQLPGVGDYTAAAIASIAFGQPVAVLDGNVERVLCRWLGVSEDPRRAPVRGLLRRAAGDLLVAGAAGDSNQALMELGALVCTVRLPRCGECPLAPACRARASGDPDALPLRRRRPAQRQVALVAAWVERGGRLLLFRRPDDDPLLAGTWELPWAPVEGGGELAAMAAADRGDRPVAPTALAQRLQARYGVTFALGEELGRLRHSITVRRLEVVLRRARLRAADGLAEGLEARWVTPGELARLPVSSLVGKAVGVVQRAAPPGPA
jgi:A/G-specific adenine glycosylase